MFRITAACAIAAAFLWLPWVSQVASATTHAGPARAAHFTTTHGIDGFTAISCSGSKSCMAVGRSGPTGQISVAASWNGSSWHLTPAPVPPVSDRSRLSGVSCPAANMCLAVGDTVMTDSGELTLVEQWNGKKWRVVTSPSPSPASGYLDAISCASGSSCMAVAYELATRHEFSLAEEWNGSSWKIVSTPNPTNQTQLLAVSCSGKPLWCMATGTNYAAATQYSALAEEWHGTKWAVVSTGTPPGVAGVLNGVSCINSVTCVAAGTGEAQTNQVTLIEAWHGHAWSVSTSANQKKYQSALASVSCAMANRCMAVGSQSHWVKNTDITGTLAETWNGSSWSIVRTLNRSNPDTAELLGAACPGPSICVAAGTNEKTSGAPVSTLAETWNGQKWVLANTPNP